MARRNVKRQSTCTPINTPQVKQFYVYPAYDRNYHITKAVDGKITGDEIIAEYSLSDVMDVLRSEGYQEAHLVQQAEATVARLKAEYELALTSLAQAKDNPFLVSDEEIANHMFLKNHLESARRGW